VTQTISLRAVPRPSGGYFFEDYTVGRRFHHVTQFLGQRFGVGCRDFQFRRAQSFRFRLRHMRMG